MRQMNDFALDGNGDLLIVAGDFVVVESTEEHMKSMLVDNYGDYPYDPLNCVGAFNYEDDDVQGDLPGAIAKTFAADGMDVVKIKVDGDLNVEVDAYYK